MAGSVFFFFWVYVHIHVVLRNGALYFVDWPQLSTVVQGGIIEIGITILVHEFFFFFGIMDTIYL